MGNTQWNIDKRFLTSKIARRIFFMFVLCAIIPLLIISVVSFFSVGRQLKQQAEDRLRQLCKSNGFQIYERLIAIEDQLNTVAWDFTHGGRERFEKDPFNPITKEGSGLRRILLLLPDGRTTPISDHLADLPYPEIDKGTQPGAGQTVIRILSGAERFPSIYMLKSIDTDLPAQGILAGEINPIYLWGIGSEGAFAPEIEMSVLSAGNQTLISSIPNFQLHDHFSKAHHRNPFSGGFETSHGGEAYTNIYWSLFLNHRFASPEWTIVLSQSRASIIAPVSHFKLSFFLMVLLTFWIILLLSLRAIRNRTTPIEALRIGAQKIAQGEFGCHVEISSGDEFDHLAQTFNEMSDKLKQGQAMLLRAAKMSTFGQMSAGIVHEIGQPLNAISGYAELLKMGISPEEQRHFLSIVCQQTERLKTIISKFRPFTRNAQEVFTQIDIDVILDKVQNLLDHNFKVKWIETERVKEGSLPLITGDDDGLQQIFLNLMTNAIDALEQNPRGERKIRIKTYAYDGVVHVEIADNGCGIPAGIQQSVYDPFFTTKGEDKGTGLGLAITSSIVHKHNGEIKLVSEVNKGTCFTVTLPAARTNWVHTGNGQNQQAAV